MLARIIFCVVFCSTLPLYAGEVLFQIGRPDGMAADFRHGINWEKVADQQGSVHKFVVGKNRPMDWIPIHLSTRDMKNAGKSFQVEIEFDAAKDYADELYFIIGCCFAHPTEPSLIHVAVNGQASEPVRQPQGPPDKWQFDAVKEIGFFKPTVIPIAKGAVKQGKNTLTIRLTDGSWLFYDYLRLADSEEVPEQLGPLDLKTDFRNGPMKDVKEVLFVIRKPSTDPHWYANFAYYAHDENQFPFPLGAGGWMNILDVDSGEVRTIFKDENGTIRDPQIHYDGSKVVFSYLPEGKRHFNLYEINVDGSGLRQLTSGDWDDIEPSYTASGDIIFCSSRGKRWVQCWLTQVATLYTCGPNGENIRELSPNVEQDNTPWPLPNGQILYTRWEYVDRSQVHYHHLWTMNPDGTRQMVYYGNLAPEIVMIDAKPIPGSNKTVASFSPGHGIREHYGRITLVDPTGGPDDPSGAIPITNHYDHCDPWAFSENAFMAARHARIELVDRDGREQLLYQLPEEFALQGFWIHEPRPIIPRMPEIAQADQTDPSKSTGCLALIDVYEGRQMQTVKRGSIKELLVLETLPEPIHYQGGMDQISIGGTFTLERIVGTIPVEPDGSALMELPALRSFFFVAMDHDGWPVKRMHSFTGVMPGEVTTCIGCHEDRTMTPTAAHQKAITKVLNREPRKPEPIADIPEVFDFVRDIQPILDRHCVECHNQERSDKGVVLCGDWTPKYTCAYETLSHRNMFGDNRNRPMSNFKPYEIGSCASKLMKLIDEKHEGATLSEHERKMVKFWLDAGANYAGTYAANVHGQIGWVYYETWIRNDLDWPEIQAMGEAIARRCNGCHTDDRMIPLTPSHHVKRFTPSWMYNLSFPEKSRIFHGPLAKSAGGYERCKEVVFADKSDPDYQAILAGIERCRQYILSGTRPCITPFYASESYTREMIRYGVLPPDHDYKTMPIDPFAVDQKYWKSLWYVPQ